MPEVEESVVIDRPRDQVFAFATDPTNVPLYNSNLIEFERLTPGPLKKGTQDRGAIKVAGKRMDWTAEAVEFEEGRRVAFRSIEAPVPFELKTTYEDVGAQAGHFFSRPLTTRWCWRKQKMASPAA